MNPFQMFQSHKKIHKDEQSSKIGETKISGKLNAMYPLDWKREIREMIRKKKNEACRSIASIVKYNFINFNTKL